MSRVWIDQDSRQKAKHGVKAKWMIYWYEGARKRSRTIGSKSLAEKARRRKEGELAAGIIDPRRTKWETLMECFLTQARTHNAASTVVDYTAIVKNYERMMQPRWVTDLTKAAIDRFIEKRKRERLAANNRPLSPATLNKDLRVLRAMVNLAEEQDMIPRAPRIKLIREPEREIEFITDAQFSAMYAAADTMARPTGRHYSRRVVACDLGVPVYIGLANRADAFTHPR